MSEFTPKNPTEFEPYSAFPIAEHSIRSSITLLSALCQPNQGFFASQRERLAHDDPFFDMYLSDMHKLRNRLHLTYELSASYDVGVVFAFNLLKEQYASRGLVLGAVDTDAVKTHFKTLLLKSPDTITDTNYAGLLRHQPSTIKTSTTPSLLLSMSESPDGLGRPFWDTATSTFVDKSHEAVGNMWEQEKYLKDAIPALRNCVGSDHFEAFAFGLSDFYWPHQIDQTIGPYAQVLDGLEY